ncbi:MAG: zinc-binding alcohol dehydrogenase family protein [Hyphomicrobiaceae bacterium]|nr:zinc-binding alcohol dehydrogenase family protein [Hyphomicrobiaceae bacterium]
MRAVIFRKSLPIDDLDALVDVDLPRPDPTGRDLLVKVEAVSVNPVDTKVRRGGDPPEGMRVLGYDASGTVAAVGSDARLFKPGDAVFYAGARERPGANSEYHLVDERIVGRKPTCLNHAEAAAVPLTAITAWELLFDRIGVQRGNNADRRSLLVVGGGGGVGSMAIQIARRLTSLTVIATASRPETQAWVRELGGHHVIDHTRPFAQELKAIGVPAPDIVLALTGTAQHAGQIAEVIAPEGHLGLIEGAAALKAFDPGPLFIKSISVHLELMFTRAQFGIPSMIEQHRLLSEVADLIDRGTLRTTLKEIVGPIDAAHLRKAHALVESGSSIGKVVLAGWPAA